MARRQATIFINGKEVRQDIKSITAEKQKLNNELKRLIIGTDEYQKKATELTKINGVINQHYQRLRGIPSAYDKMKAGLTSFLGIAAAAFTINAVLDYGKQLFDLGGQMEILEAKAQTVFGETLPRINEEAEKNAAAMGLTTAEYISQAAAIQDLLIPMGFQRDEAAGITIELTNLSGALSEWTGGQIKSADVTRILSKAMLGEREELKQLGISIQEADVKARLAEKGLDKLTGTLLQQAKAAATLELITEKSVDAQTAFANNTDTVVRKQAELSAKITQIKENLATLLIPVFQRLIGVVEPFVDLITRFTTIPVVEKLEEEQQALNLLVTQITEANISQEDRNKLITQLQNKYPDFLGNLNAETVTNDQLADRLREVNDQYIFKIALQKEDDKIQKAAEKTANAQRELAKKDLETTQKLLKLNEEYRLGLDFTNKSLQERIDITKEGLRAFQEEGGNIGLDLAALEASGRKVIESRVDARKDELEQLKLAREEIKKNLAAELGIDLNANTSTSTPAANNSALKDAAELEEKKKIAEESAKELEKKQEKERQLVEDHLQQLKEAEAKFREELRVSTLSEDEQALAQIRQRYQKEIDLAKELEEKGITEATARRFELMRIRDEEIDLYQANKAQERLDKQLEQLEAEEELEIENLFDFLDRKTEAENTIKEELNEALLEERDLQFLQLKDHYDGLIALAKDYGIETTDITKAFENKKTKIEEEEQKKRKKLEEDLVDARLNNFKAVSDGLSQLVGENEVLTKGLFLFEKGVAAAEIIINLQRELSTISTTVGAFPVLGAALAAAAKVRAGIRLATIAGTAIQGIAQRKKGGYFDVTGEDDGRQYHARYIGDPKTGMLPPYPVVLASEAGPEYFVSNRDLRHPKVLNHVRAIENIRKARVPQFQDGGANAPLPAGIDSNPQTDAEMLSLLREISDKLNSFNAVLDNDTIIGIIRQYNKLQSAAGGTLL